MEEGGGLGQEGLDQRRYGDRGVDELHDGVAAVGAQAGRLVDGGVEQGRVDDVVEDATQERLFHVVA